MFFRGSTENIDNKSVNKQNTQMKKCDTHFLETYPQPLPFDAKNLNSPFWRIKETQAPLLNQLRLDGGKENQFWSPFDQFWIQYLKHISCFLLKVSSKVW